MVCHGTGPAGCSREALAGLQSSSVQALAVVCAPVALCLHPRRRHAPPLPVCGLWPFRPRPSSTGHELGTLHPRAVGWSVAVQGARSTSVVVVSLDEAVQCSARACSEVTSCQPNAAPQPLEAAVVSHTRSHSTTQASDGGMSRRASAPWRMCRGEESGAAAVQWWLACVACWKEARLALPYGVRRRPGGAIWFGLGVTVGDAAN